MTTRAAAEGPLSRRTAWPRNLPTPLREFLSAETGRAAVLLGATIAALFVVGLEARREFDLGEPVKRRASPCRYWPRLAGWRRAAGARARVAVTWRPSCERTDPGGRYGRCVDDASLRSRIEEMVAEEQQLLEAGQGQGPDAERHARLAELKTELDRSWDLLRQREAREEFDLDPGDGSVRDTDTVEGYEQ